MLRRPATAAADQILQAYDQTDDATGLRLQTYNCGFLPIPDGLRLAATCQFLFYHFEPMLSFLQPEMHPTKSLTIGFRSLLNLPLLPYETRLQTLSTVLADQQHGTTADFVKNYETLTPLDKLTNLLTIQAVDGFNPRHNQANTPALDKRIVRDLLRDLISSSTFDTARYFQVTKFALNLHSKFSIGFYELAKVAYLAAINSLGTLSQDDLKNVINQLFGNLFNKGNPLSRVHFNKYLVELHSQVESPVLDPISLILTKLSSATDLNSYCFSVLENVIHYLYSTNRFDLMIPLAEAYFDQHFIELPSEVGSIDTLTDIQSILAKLIMAAEILCEDEINQPINQTNQPVTENRLIAAINDLITKTCKTIAHHTASNFDSQLAAIELLKRFSLFDALDEYQKLRDIVLNSTDGSFDGLTANSVQLSNYFQIDPETEGRLTTSELAQIFLSNEIQELTTTIRASFQ